MSFTLHGVQVRRASKVKCLKLKMAANKLRQANKWMLIGKAHNSTCEEKPGAGDGGSGGGGSQGQQRKGRRGQATSGRTTDRKPEHEAAQSGFDFITLPDGEGHRVTSVSKTTHADGGVRPGDYIVRVNGRSTQGLAHEEVRMLLFKQVSLSFQNTLMLKSAHALVQPADRPIPTGCRQRFLNNQPFAFVALVLAFCVGAWP